MSPARELFDRRLQSRSLAALFGAGAVLPALALVFPHDAKVDALGVLLTAAGLLVGAVAFFVWADTMPRWGIRAGLLLGIGAITVLNHFSGFTAGFSLFYTWLALFAFYFMDRREAVAYTALIGVAYAGLLAANDAPSVVVRWLLLVGTPLATGLLISRLLVSLKQEATSADMRADAIEQRDERTRMVLETAHDAYVEIDPEGRVRVWNSAAEAMFGWPREQAVGEQLADLLYAPEDREAHHERRRRVLDEATLHENGPTGSRLFESLVRHRDGFEIPVEVSVSLVRTGDSIVLPAFYRDLRDRHRREQEQAQLHHAQAAREEAEQLAGMVSELQGLVDAALGHRRLDALLHDLMGRLRDVLRAEAATIAIVDEDHGDMVIRASTAAVSPDGLDRVAIGEGFAGRVAAERGPLVLSERPDYVLDPAMHSEAIQSLVGVPLNAGGEVKGVIQLGASRQFDDDDVRLLVLAADRVALAIDNARVFEREHRIAETLQRSLLPERLPDVPGLDIAARYIPAAAEAEVGGDWYDAIPIPGGRVGLVMGDVAGKGLAAASMVGRMRSALRAYALEGHEPAVVVERLNRLLWTELEDSQMATLLYMVFDPEPGTLHWVNAGHPPPLVMADGRTSYLDGGRGVPLGVMAFPTFEDAIETLDPGSVVLLYTDGLVERPGAHLDDGMQRLAREVAGVPRDPDRICDHLLATMVEEGSATDDVALLALHNTPMGEHISAELPAEPESLASIRALLRRWLHHGGIEAGEVGEIISATGEACANAIEHGTRHGNARFRIWGELSGDGELLLTVHDDGSWRPARDGDQGRGLSLMEALMDTVEVEREDGGTTVRMRRRVRSEVGA